LKIKQLSNDIDAKKYLTELNVDSGGIKILAKKMSLHLYLIENMHYAAANILKQDALSIGADLAVPQGVITCSQERVNAILIGSRKHIEILSRKELAQPFGLKEIAKDLQQLLKQVKMYNPRIMGVINANDDSFYSESRFKESNALEAIYKMKSSGATIIDIGGVSSRPGASNVSSKDELLRVKPIINSLYEQKMYDEIELSIDSYSPNVISYALERGFHIVNDITGLQDDDVCKLISTFNATAVIMHMQGTPETMQSLPSYKDVVLEIDEFFNLQIEKAKSFAIEKIMLDVGIGFGKTLEHNLELLKHLEHFTHHGYELLFGASRKSMINQILDTPIEKRLSATLALHLKAIENGATVIRVHDVEEHFQMLSVHEALKLV